MMIVTADSQKSKQETQKILPKLLLLKPLLTRLLIDQRLEPITILVLLNNLMRIILPLMRL